jgi:hypothetical protein
MKLIKTINKIVEESKIKLDEAAEKGVNEKELERLEKNYENSLKLFRIYSKIKK